MKAARVLIVEEHPLTRVGMKDVICAQQDLKVCCEAATGNEALSKVAACPPDLIITCLDLPDRHGLEMIKDLKASHPRLPILVVSMRDESLYAERALQAGASGYLMKNEAVDRLMDAIRTVLAGKIYASPNMSEIVLQNLSTGAAREGRSLIAALTDREFEVFQLLGEGLTTQQIAEHLRLSPKAVETHRLHIRDKLKIGSGMELLKHAMRWVGSQEFL